MRSYGRILLAGILLIFATHLQAAEITWVSGFVDADSDVSDFGTVLEAYAFTGDRDTNAQAGTLPLEDPFEVNGTLFTPLNFTQGQYPEFLQGMTYDHGEYGHTLAESGYLGLMSGLAFQTGVDTQLMELTDLTVGQGYQVEFYFYHSTADRTVTFDDGLGNTATVVEGGVDVGGFASGYFVADASFQEIIATANTGSQYLNGYQLRAVNERPPLFDDTNPPVSIPDLIGYWSFEGNADDLSGHDNHGMVSGGVTFDSDVPSALGAGLSANFDGLADSHIEITHNSMMPVTSHTDFTISMWVRGDGTVDNVDDRVFSEGMTTNTNPLFNLGTHNAGEDGRFDFFYRNGSSTGHVYSDGELFDDDWHHLTWVDRNDQGTLYIDGVEDTTFDYSAHPSFTADVTSIGSVLRATDCCNFTGNIDDVAIFSYALGEDDILALAGGASPLAIVIPGSVVGDFDNDGLLTAADIDLLTGAVSAQTNNPAFDLDNDGLVNEEDRRVWVEDLRYTYFGDATLDGEFNSADFVAVFQAGEYEDGVPANSTWATGDWDGDHEFATSDFVAAFQAGGYEIGPRPAITAVPEPSSGAILCVGLCLLGAGCRRCGSYFRADKHTA